MFWSKKPPNELEDYSCKNPIPQIKREELNCKSLAIIGMRNSGKSNFLAKSLIHKSDQENALVLCTYATERPFWNNVVKTYNITKTVIHTPDSLARYLLGLWAKKEGKRLDWVLDRELVGNASSNRKQEWHDEKGYALWLLKRNKMTAGIAHWLLSNEIENFVENKMLPNLDILCLDEPEEWEEEAAQWVKLLPRTRTFTATKSTRYLWKECEYKRILPGTYDWQGKLVNYRYIKILPSLPTVLSSNSCLIHQHPITPKDLKNKCKKYKGEIRRAEQTKGRHFKELYIDNMPTNKESTSLWGKKVNCLKELDLLASKARSFGIIKSEDESSYLPPRPDNQRFLIWKPQLYEAIEKE